MMATEERSEPGYLSPEAKRRFTVIAGVLGTVFFDTRRSGPRAARGTASGERINALPGDAFPTLRAHRAEFTMPSEDDVFSFGLRALLDGLERRFPGPSPSTNASSAR